MTTIRDGDWADGGEEIFSGRSLAAGTNSLSFAVPGTAVVGTTYARFRCTTDGAVTFNDEASDGEVEDYQVTIQIATPCPSDFDDNWWVNAADFSIMITPEEWHCTGECGCDLDGNGQVNALDLSILLGHWGECP